MSQTFLLVPPIAFAIVLLAALGLSAAMSRLAFKAKSQSAAATEPYACGEDIPTHLIQPNYGQFLPFAFFFTILHVVALTVTTVPAHGNYFIAVLYIVGALVGLSVLFRRYE